MNQKVSINKDFHIIKGIQYKDGEIPSMLIATASKNTWNEANNDEKPPQTPSSVDISEKIIETSKNLSKHEKTLISKDPSIRKGFLLRDKVSKSSQNKLIHVIDEKSSVLSSNQTKNDNLTTSHRESSTKSDIARNTVENVIKVSESQESDAISSKEPTFTMTERGKIDLGDFNGMERQNVISNRPNELIYKIHVPKASKVSQLVLDVSER